MLDFRVAKPHTGLMSATAVPPTADQTSFIKGLLDELRDKYGDDTMRAPLNEAYANRTLTRTSASAVIESLIAIRDYKRSQAPVTPKPVAAQVVADGHYALDVDGVIKFYEVRNGSGKWEGYTFLDAVASDERYPIKNRQNRDEILARIAVAPLEALKLYGREIGVCGHCGRTLTSDHRKNGLGPICAKKFA